MPTKFRWLATLAAVALAACASPETRSPGRLLVVDDAGDSVALAGPATRVVSLIPTTTELIFAFGAGSVVVGRSTWCDWPARARQVADLGDGIAPSIEAIVGTRPDLVVLYRSPTNAAVVRQLRTQGITTIQLRVDNLDDMARATRVLAHALGRDSEADSLQQAVDSSLAAASVSSESGPRAFLLVWEQPITTIGRGSFLAELVHRAGGRNVFDDVSASSAPVSLEAVVSRDPDIVLALSPGQAPPSPKAEWRAIRAVREGKFVALEGSHFLRPTPRVAQAIVELREIFRERMPQASAAGGQAP